MTLESHENRPWLFQRRNACGRSAQDYARDATEHFGETARWFQQKRGHAWPRECPPDGPLAIVWEHAVAAETMLLSPALRSESGVMAPTALPCGVGFRCSELSGCRAAAALFPLASVGGTAAPTLGRIWALQGDGLIQPALPLANSETLVQLAAIHGAVLAAEIPDGATVHGSSWQLAARLALWAVDASVSDETRVALAAGYIVTGTLAGNDRVGSVWVDGKFAAVADLSRRVWLIPQDDRVAFQAAQGNRRVVSECVVSAPAAFALVAGHGTRPGGVTEWPASLGAMHALVGESIAATLAAALFADVGRLHLWHSRHEDKSIVPARRIERILMRQRPALRIDLNLLRSDELVEAERALEPFFPRALAETMFFNITSGNRLQGLAAARFARQSEHVRLIYRDWDNTGLDYVQIAYEGGAPHTGTLRPSIREGDSRWALFQQLLGPREGANKLADRMAVEQVF